MEQRPAQTANGERQSLTADDWATAALDAMAAGGLESVAIEPLARQLGVTKGSFYWHFANRDALIRAALERWEREETDDIIARVGDAADPYERIVRVFKSANASYRSGRLYLALAAASDRPAIQQAVRRVSERRMAYLLDCYRALGLSEADARRWSTFAYATFMGNLQIRRDVPEAIPENQQFNDYLRLMIETLIPRVRREEQHPAAAEDRNDPPLQAVV
ncbi:TetR/AcrR family transcriptional regulator [Algiphilus sp.]|uniref:TetR/AcrR family transcriptional regulator n=1 Tax=Algiphilus sp. TaxID=1872431 RepID=UPI0025B85A00|nr:TetR/AcrR family transcriptional regulator [Algiphilus sp.]MCK5771229.1 TetR/AcrR family transcriptional regulator [Algiphilus sp.]